MTTYKQTLGLSLITVVRILQAACVFQLANLYNTPVVTEILAQGF